MRRRQVRTIREDERPTLLLMAAGAVAGAAAGLYLGRRYRSMDAFLSDVRHRLSDLRDLWYDDELSTRERVRAGAAALSDEEEEEEEDRFDDLDEDELEDEAFETEALEDELVDEEEIDEEEEIDDEEVIDEEDEFEDEEAFEDEFDDDLAAVTSENGASDAAMRADEKARRLEARVLNALRDEPVLGARAIELAVVGDGVVELTGTVHTIEEIARASLLVRTVPGVSMVLNRIEVRPGGHGDAASVPREPIETTDNPAVPRD
jgi:hypothetical protein